MRILGIDPGTIHVGFGLIEWQPRANRADYLTCGTIDLPPKLPIAARLQQLRRELYTILDKHRPDCLGLESAFFKRNAKSAMRIGEARAICMLTAQEHQLQILEIPPATVKKLVTGNGRATKPQIQKMVQLVLALNAPPRSADAADALAIALATAYRNRYHA